jgi:hypothetical protein
MYLHVRTTYCKRPVHIFCYFVSYPFQQLAFTIFHSLAEEIFNILKGNISPDNETINLIFIINSVFTCSEILQNPPYISVRANVRTLMF